MNIGFLVITFGDNFLENCIQSIRKFYELPIYVIDNNINENININNLEKYNQVFYSKNTINSFELGAIWHACKVFPHVDKFVILHNSMMIIEKLPFNIEDIHFMSFWKTVAADYSPVIFWVKDKLKFNNNIDIEYDKMWFSVTGCCCIIDTIYLKKLIELGYDKLYGIKKNEAVSTEILFGYLITNILNIANNSLFECTLDDNVSGRVDYKYIKKFASGQGYGGSCKQIDLSQVEIFDKIFKIKLTNHSDLNECYIKLINEIDKDENIDIQQFLLNSIDTDIAELIYPDKNFSVISSIRHTLSTKFFFPTYYETEKNLILTHKKKLFQ